MTAIVERIKNEIHSLAPDEARELFQELRRDFSSIMDDQDSVEAEWDEEIDARVQEIENGTVQLLTAEESERRSDAVFARLGIQRPVYAP